MAVRLGLDESGAFADRKSSGVVDQGGDVLLLHDIHLLTLHSIEVVSLKQSHCPVVSVIRHHDAEGDKEVVTEGRVKFLRSGFTGKGVLCVELQVRVIVSDGANREADLYARETQPLTKTTSDQNEAKFGQLLQTELLHFVKVWFSRLEEDSIGNLGLIGVEGIHVVAGSFEKGACAFAVVLETTRCHLL